MEYKALLANTRDISLHVLGTEQSWVRSRNIGEAQYQHHFRQIKAKTVRLESKADIVNIEQESTEVPVLMVKEIRLKECVLPY